MNPHVPSASMLTPLRRFWPALAGAAVLALVATTLGGGEILQRLGRADPGLFALAVLAVQPQVVLSALRWRFVSERLDRPLPVGRAIGEYYLASLLNQVLPGGVAGDAVRAVRATREGGDGRWTGPGAQAVVLDRLSGQIVLFAAAGIGLLAAPFVFDAEPPGGMGVLALLGGALAAGLIGWIALRLLGERAAAFRRGFGPALAESFVRRGAWAVQAAASTAVVGSYLLAFALSAAAVGAPLGAVATLLLVPLVLLSMLIPVSIGGWGLREAAAAGILPLAGVAPDGAFAASVVYGVASLVGALPGLLVLLRHAVLARWRAAT